MGAKFIKKLNKFPEMTASLQAIDGKTINVGVKGEHAWLASIHEYGCRIKVTPKMRAWLHANGLHIKEATTEIVIPERSFLRSGFDECHEKVLDRAERMLSQLIDGTISENDFYDFVGGFLRDCIQDYAEDMTAPAKHPFTLQRNGGKADLLTDTGDMINSIEYDVE